MAHGRPLSIATRTTLTTLVVLVVCFGIAGTLFVQRIVQRSDTDARAQVILLARTLAGAMAAPLSHGNHEAIQRQVDQIAELPEKFSDVDRVVVVDPAGRIVAHTDPTLFNEPWGHSVPVTEELREEPAGPDSFDGAPRLVAIVPIETSIRFGTLELSVTARRPFAASREAVRFTVVGLVLLMLVLAVLLMAVLGVVVVRPLRRLARDVSQWKAGHGELPGASDQGSAEVLSLVESFGRLAGRIGEQTAELEAKVAERTRELSTAYDRLTMANRQLQELAVTDGLTGVANRRALQDRLGVEVERARRNRTPLTLVLFDLDHFKVLNDTLGHLEGDAALVQLAGLLQEGRRGADLVARYGGEEFVLLLPDTPHADGLLVAERLRQSTQDAPLPANCTVSAGVATLPDQAEDARALIAAADHALYAAKSGGRNRVESAAAPPAAAQPAEAP